MRLAPLLLAAACAAPRPPPARTADSVVVEQVQVGWMQLSAGRPDHPPVEILNGGPAPDETHAREIAEGILARCEKGAPMAALQKQFSEEDPGQVTVDGAARVPFRDYALSLHPGECGLVRSDVAFHVIKRVR